MEWKRYNSKAMFRDELKDGSIVRDHDGFFHVVSDVDGYVCRGGEFPIHGDIFYTEDMIPKVEALLSEAQEDFDRDFTKNTAP